jgi:hypothetical protein
MNKNFLPCALVIFGVLFPFSNFAAPLTFSKTTLAVGSGPSFVLAADLSGNGHPDIICPNYGFRYGCIGDETSFGSNITEWVNNGKGGFSSHSTIAVLPHISLNNPPEPPCIAAADFNGTGHLDLVVPAAWYNLIDIFTNNGKGGFKFMADFPAMGRDPLFIAAADLDRDGRPDLVTVNNLDSTLSVYTNMGGYAFFNTANLAVGSQPASVLIADVNSDGLPDLISADYGTCGSGNTLTIYINAGRGNFVHGQVITVGYGPTCVVAADVNGDGRVDLISANQNDGTLSVLTNIGNGTFALQTNLTTLSPSFLVATNISGSGHIDLACANSDNGYPGSVTIFTGDGHGNFTSNSTVSTGPVGSYPDSITAADFNGDGKMDLVVANYGTSNLTVLTQTTATNGSGTPPVVSITAPTNGANFANNEPLKVTASAQSAKGITAVFFLLDGAQFGVATAAPYTCTAAAGSIAIGGHELQAVATDGAGISNTSAQVHITASASGTATIDFDALNATTGTVEGTALANYLAAYGVTIANVTPGSTLEAVNTSSFSGSVTAPSSPNIFTEAGANQPMSFTLRFSSAVQAFQFTRAGLTIQTGTASHPAWTATAFDGAGREVASVSEGLIASPRPVAAQQYILSGGGITSVRFDSDSQSVAAFPAILLDNLVLNYNVVTLGLSVVMNTLSAGNPVAGTSITLNADVTDSLSKSYAVSFFANGTLLGTATGSPYEISTSFAAGNYNLQAIATDSSGYVAGSPFVPLTVQPAVNSTVMNFDGLNASRGPVTGAAVTKYFASYGVSVASISGGTALTVETGGASVQPSSPPNFLTQTGSNGPVQFTLSFSPLLSQISFTRPELLANPFVSHPVWQATAYDGAGNILSQAGESEIDSSTNVDAQQFTLSYLGGPGIARVQFASEGSGLTTFNAIVLDDLVLNRGATTFPPAVAVTQPVFGQILPAPPALTITAAASDPSGIKQVSFYANPGQVLLGTASGNSSPYSIIWTNPPLGNYRLYAVATDASGLTSTSSLVRITVVSASQLVISSEPLNQTVSLGASATFNVVTTGATGVTYQWSHNGNPITGATSSTLVVGPPIQDSDAGAYGVSATANGTPVYSATAELTVVDPPAFTLQPQGQAVSPGTTVVLNTAASGTGPLTWQWLLNGVNIPGATTAEYVIPAAQPRRSGIYQVVVANSFASSISGITPVVVQTSVIIPQTNTNFANRAAINPLLGPITARTSAVANEAWFTWQATFSGPVSLTTLGSAFDTILSVYTGATLQNLKTVATDDDSGGFLTSMVTFNATSNTVYQIEVNGHGGASGRIVLGLPEGAEITPVSGGGVAVITREPVSQVVAANARVTLSVTAASVGHLGYLWEFDGNPIPGATAASLVINHLTPAAIGVYDVLVSNAVGWVQSEPASLQIAADQGVTATAAQNKFPTSIPAPSPKMLAHVLHPHATGGDTRGYIVAQVFSTVGAQSEPGEPMPCGQIGSAPQWFRYTALASGTMLVSTAGSSFNTLLGVYTGSGTSFADLVEAGCGYTTNYAVEAQPSVVLDNVVQGGTYYILVDGFQGATGVAQLQIGLGRALYFGAVPTSHWMTAGGSVTFSATAVGSTPVSYQWQLNGANVPGATKSAYVLAGAQEQSAGNYSLVISNMLGAITSSPPAQLTLQYGPAIVSGPTNETVTVGQKATFSVLALGVNVKTNLLAAQWYFNGAPLAKANSTVLSIPGATTNNDGTYYLVLSNHFGVTNSSPATLTVVPKPQPKIKEAGLLSQSFTYCGLFYPTNGPTESSSGFLTLTLAREASGAFSANLLLDGGAYSFTGQFDSAGNSESIIARLGKTPLTAMLHLDLNSPNDKITGVISSAGWQSTLLTLRTTNNLFIPGEGKFALLIPSEGNALAGNLSVNNTSPATALVTGTLADGAGIFRVAPVAQAASIPLYVPLYSGKGLFLGWITLTNGLGQSNCGNAIWINSKSTNAIEIILSK